MATATINSVELFYKVIGEGEPVAFLNGVLMTADAWAQQTSVLGRRYRCILHDCRGQLMSEKPDQPYSMKLHAEDLGCLLDHLEIERCHVVGTSYGGEIGMVFAIAHPERVKSLTVISSVSEVDPLLRAHTQAWASAANTGDLETLLLGLRSLCYSETYLAKNEQAVLRSEQMMRGLPQEFFSAFVRLVDAFLELEITEELSRVRTPTLVVVGERDLIKTPRHSQIIAHAIPNAEHVIIPGAGHAVVYEHPDVINTLISGFVEKHR